MTRKVYHISVTFDIPALDADHAMKMLKDGLLQWEMTDQIPEYKIHPFTNMSYFTEDTEHVL